jgi:hypothetical protein
MQLLHFGAATAIMRGARFIGAEEAPVGNPANNGFDPKAFLAKVGAGKTILKFEKNQHVFRQGDVAVEPERPYGFRWMCASTLLHSVGIFVIRKFFISAAMRNCPAFLMASVRFDPCGNFLALPALRMLWHPNRDYRYCRASVSHHNPGGKFSSPESQPLTLDSVGSLETISV